jgi:hypothetical protein
MSIFRKYGYLWVTGLLFLVSITLQWLTHDGSTAEFVNAVMENWQSEFLQLVWQVGGLMLLYAWGSSQSRDEQEKNDNMLKAILKDVRELRNELISLRRMRREPDQFQPVGEPKPPSPKPPAEPARRKGRKP